MNDGNPNAAGKDRKPLEDPAGKHPRGPWIRRGEQAVVGLAMAAFLLAAAGYALVERWEGRRRIDIDHARPLVAEFEVDVNRAAWPELAQLPEIGQTLARRIVEEREVAGEYRSHDDLLRVRGIGPRTLERIRPFLAPLPAAAAVAADDAP